MGRWVSAVGIQHTHVQCWLPSPPVAVLILSAETVALLDIFGVFEVKGISLKVINLHITTDILAM